MLVLFMVEAVKTVAVDKGKTLSNLIKGSLTEFSIKLNLTLDEMIALREDLQEMDSPEVLKILMDEGKYRWVKKT